MVTAFEKLLVEKAHAVTRVDHMNFEEAPTLRSERTEELLPASGNKTVQVARGASGQVDVRTDAPLGEMFGQGELDDGSLGQIHAERRPTQPHAPKIITPPDSGGRKVPA